MERTKGEFQWSNQGWPTTSHNLSGLRFRSTQICLRVLVTSHAIQNLCNSVYPRASGHDMIYTVSPGKPHSEPKATNKLQDMAGGQQIGPGTVSLELL